MKSIVGIDVAKDELVIYMNEQHYTVDNTDNALNLWFKKHVSHISAAELFVYEPTGGYEKRLAKWLQEKNLPSRRVHANHIRHFAKAMGGIAKTDKIDAKWIAEYARVKNYTASEQVLHAHAPLCALVARREQLLVMKKQENSRLETLDDAWVQQNIEQHIALLKENIKAIDAQIKQYIKSQPLLSRQVKLMTSIPGVGDVTAMSLLAYLPEIAQENNKSLAALSGLAPMNRDSGRKEGKRNIYGGRSQVRRVLYMAAFVARQRNSVIKPFYDRLIAKGKPYRVATTAAMRKLLTIIRSVIDRGTPWQTELNTEIC